MKSCIPAVIPALLLGLSDALPATDLLVPDQFETIQEAIDASEDGDRILIGPGVHREHLMIDHRELTLEPIDSSTSVKIISPDEFGPPFVALQVNNGARVTLRRLRIVGAGNTLEAQDGHIAIGCTDSEITVLNCEIEGGYGLSGEPAIHLTGQATAVVMSTPSRNVRFLAV
ncbi:hypothetical protein JXA47_01910 [Candidatus Sumerlaeota bacterium]|nr:hypothetical protein [Candidatus Sumerlaeota bacterium]